MKRWIAILFIPLLLLGACTGNTTAPALAQTEATHETTREKAPEGKNTDAHRAQLIAQEIAPLSETFVQGINAYGFDAARRLYTEDQNLAISPVSIELALLMTHEGAAGQTADDIAAAMMMDGMPPGSIAPSCKSLMWRANTGGMQAANAIWLGSRYTYSNDFLAVCTGEYMADAMPLVIPGAMDDINAWVNEKTHGKIDSIYAEELSEATEAVLCNTLYYLGEWVKTFEANDTWDNEFYAPDGEVIVPFMHSEWYVPHYRCDAFDMISLDFVSPEDEGQYAMAFLLPFLLPPEGQTAGDLLGEITADMFADALSGMEKQDVIIALPKFEYDFSSSLKQTLIDQGAGAAFGFPEADFSKMTVEDNNLFISDVLHKCYIRVDELGAEAAAVTVVEMAEGAMEEEEEPLRFTADRPFVYAIYSKEDGAIAFLGALNDPS